MLAFHGVTMYVKAAVWRQLDSIWVPVSLPGLRTSLQWQGSGAGGGQGSGVADDGVAGAGVTAGGAGGRTGGGVGGLAGDNSGVARSDVVAADADHHHPVLAHDRCHGWPSHDRCHCHYGRLFYSNPPCKGRENSTLCRKACRTQ